MNFLLEVNVSQPIEDFNEKLLYGGKTMLIGMLTIFSVLIILWFTLVLFKVFFHDLAHAKKTTKPIMQEAPAPVHNAPMVSENDEIVAVIAAAIAMAESESCGNKKFRVVSFKRK